MIIVVLEVTMLIALRVLYTRKESFYVHRYSHQNQHESAKHKQHESIEGEPLGTSDALPEETAVVVQIQHTSLTFSTVIHIDSLTITLLAEFYLVCFLPIHVPFTNDTRIHEDC